MATGSADITIKPGVDFEEVFRLEVLPTDAHGDELDFWDGSWTAAAQMRRKYAEDEVLLEFEIDLSTSLKIAVSATAAETEDVERSGVWDLELTETTTGRVIRFARGRAKLEPDVTRVGS